MLQISSMTFALSLPLFHSFLSRLINSTSSPFSPKNAIAQIKKKMQSPNPHTAMYALTVLESVVKNCGAPIHDEISSKTNCEMYTSLINSTPHENVRAKMLELIQCWAYAFRSTPKYRAIKVSCTVTDNNHSLYIKIPCNLFPLTFA